MTEEKMKELIARLQFIGRYASESSDQAATRRNENAKDAADAISSLLAQVERMREALEPFARDVEDLDRDRAELSLIDLPDSVRVVDVDEELSITLGNFRKARSALNTEGGK